MKNLQVAFLTLMLLGSGMAFAAAAPPLFSADYTVHADGFQVGEMKRSLKAMGNDTFVLETRAYTTGLVAIFKKDEYVERSIWRVTREGYVPIEFSSRYTGRSKDVLERLRFDWARKVIHSLRDGKETQIALEPGVLDKLMWQVVMRDDLARGVKNFRYRVADRGKIQDYKLEVTGEENLTTVVGAQRTIKIKKGTTMLWCAVGLDYMPVKLEQKDDGHTLATYLTSLKREPPPALTFSPDSAPAPAPNAVTPAKPPAAVKAASPSSSASR